jgi:hypothetical protein
MCTSSIETELPKIYEIAAAADKLTPEIQLAATV